MKKIIIKAWLKFTNTKHPEALVVDLFYKHGYWNVMQYNEPLEKFLIDNNIDHKVTDKIL